MTIIKIIKKTPNAKIRGLLGLFIRKILVFTSQITHTFHHELRVISCDNLAVYWLGSNLTESRENYESEQSNKNESDILL
jgi:hypothetical protein